MSSTKSGMSTTSSFKTPNIPLNEKQLLYFHSTEIQRSDSEATLRPRKTSIPSRSPNLTYKMEKDPEHIEDSEQNQGIIRTLEFTK